MIGVSPNDWTEPCPYCDAGCLNNDRCLNCYGHSYVVTQRAAAVLSFVGRSIGDSVAEAMLDECGNIQVVNGGVKGEST